MVKWMANREWNSKWLLKPFSKLKIETGVIQRRFWVIPFYNNCLFGPIRHNDIFSQLKNSTPLRIKSRRA